MEKFKVGDKVRLLPSQQDVMGMTPNEMITASEQDIGQVVKSGLKKIYYGINDGERPNDTVYVIHIDEERWYVYEENIEHIYKGPDLAIEESIWEI